MPGYFYVHVPKDSRRNLEIGIANGIWGWRERALRARPRGERLTYGDMARSIAIGDYLILGFYGPNPRDKEETYVSGRLRRLTIAKIKRPLYLSEETVWPDDTYPRRVDLEIESDDVPGSQLGVAAMLALRRSANTQGVPVPGDAFVVAVPAEGEDDLSEAEELPLDVDGNLDAVAVALRRREQAKLRAKKFQGRAVIECDLCGRLLPRRLVWAAHIKRRADANIHERLDPANVMAACLLGCDALFEHGYIHVDSSGFVRTTLAEHEVLAQRLSPAVGRRCTAFRDSSRAYFAAHAARAATIALAARSALDTAWPRVTWHVDPSHVALNTATIRSGSQR
jgi:hypothetical protein